MRRGEWQAVAVDIPGAQAFLREHHRAVLITLREDGRPHPTPVLCGLDDEGRVAVSTTEATAKVRHVRRDPRVSACVVNDGFFGPWVYVEGTAELLPLPEAMEELVALYRRVAGEHPDWDEFRQAMTDQRRVLLRFPIERAGPA